MADIVKLQLGVDINVDPSYISAELNKKISQAEKNAKDVKVKAKLDNSEIQKQLKAINDLANNKLKGVNISKALGLQADVLSDSTKSVQQYRDGLQEVIEIMSRMAKMSKTDLSIYSKGTDTEQERLLQKQKIYLDQEEEIAKLQKSRRKELESSVTKKSVSELEDLYKTSRNLKRALSETADVAEKLGLASKFESDKNVKKEVEEVTRLKFVYDKLLSTREDLQKSSGAVSRERTVQNTQDLITVFTTLESKAKELGFELKDLFSNGYQKFDVYSLQNTLTNVVEADLANARKQLQKFADDYNNELAKINERVFKRDTVTYTENAKNLGKRGTGTGTGNGNGNGSGDGTGSGNGDVTHKEFDSLKNTVSDLSKRVDVLDGRVTEITSNMGQGTDSVDLYKKSIEALGEDFQDVAKFAVDAETAFEKLNKLWSEYDKTGNLPIDELHEMYSYMERLLALDTHDLNPKGLSLSEDQENEYATFSMSNDNLRILDKIQDMTDAQISKIEELKRLEPTLENVVEEINKVQDEFAELKVSVESIGDTNGVKELTSQIETMTEKLVEATNRAKPFISAMNSMDAPLLTEEDSSKPLVGYRGTNGSHSGAVSDAKGITFYTTNEEVARKRYAQGGKVTRANFAMKNPLEADLGGQRWNDITWLGNGLDEESSALKALDAQIVEHEKHLARLKEGSKKYNEVQAEMNTLIEQENKILNDPSKPYVKHGDTDTWAAKIKENNIAEGMVLKNIIDGEGVVATDIITFDSYQIKNAETMAAALEHIAEAEKKVTDNSPTDKVESPISSADSVLENVEKQASAQAEVTQEVEKTTEKYKTLEDVLKNLYYPIDSQVEKASSQWDTVYDLDAKGEIPKEDYIKKVMSDFSSFFANGEEGFNQLKAKAEETASGISEIDEAVKRVSKMSSIKDLSFDDLASEAVTVTSRISTMYDEGITDTEEYIALQYKLFKIFDEYGKSYGGVKGSGAKNSTELRQWIMNSWERETDGLFDRNGSWIDAIWGGGSTSIVDTEKSGSSLLKMKDVLAEISKYTGIISKFNGSIALGEDENSLKTLQTLIGLLEKYKILSSTPANETAVSSTENVENIKAEEAATTALTEAKEKLVQTEKEEKGTSQDDSQVPELTAEEQAMAKLQEALLQTTLAVRNKNSAFEDEAQIVASSVGLELGKLDESYNALVKVGVAVKELGNIPVTLDIDFTSLQNFDPQNAEAVNNLKDAVNNISATTLMGVVTQLERLGQNNLAQSIQSVANSILNLKTNLNNLTLNSSTFVSDLAEIAKQAQNIKVLVDALQNNPNALNNINNNVNPNTQNPNALKNINITDTEENDIRARIASEQDLVDVLGDELNIIKQIRTVKGEQYESYRVTGKNGSVTFGRSTQGKGFAYNPLNASVKGSDDYTASKAAERINAKAQADAEKAVTNALRDQASAVEEIVKLRAKLKTLDPNTQQDNISLVKSQIKEQQAVYQAGEQILNQNKNIVSQNERINNSIEARRKALLEVKAVEENSKNKADAKAQAEQEKELAKQQKESAKFKKEQQNALDKAQREYQQRKEQADKQEQADITASGQLLDEIEKHYYSILNLKRQISLLDSKTDVDQISKLQDQLSKEESAQKNRINQARQYSNVSARDIKGRIDSAKSSFTLDVNAQVEKETAEANAKALREREKALERLMKKEQDYQNLKALKAKDDADSDGNRYIEWGEKQEQALKKVGDAREKDIASIKADTEAYKKFTEESDRAAESARKLADERLAKVSKANESKVSNTDKSILSSVNSDIKSLQSDLKTTLDKGLDTSFSRISSTISDIKNNWNEIKDDKFSDVQNNLRSALSIVDKFDLDDKFNLDDNTEKFKQQVYDAYTEVQRISELLKEASNSNTFDIDNVERYTNELAEASKKLGELRSKRSDSNNLLGNTLSVDKLLQKATKDMAENTAMSKETKAAYQALIDTMNGKRLTASKNEVIEFSGELTRLKTRLSEAKETGKSFFDMFTSRVKGMSASALAQYFSLYDIIRYTKEAAQTVREYDTALTEMRKVSDESVASLKAYQKESFGVADSVGTTAKALQNSTADWLRLGESFEEAKESAKDATVLLNVSEFESIDAATESLVSASQAFKDLDKMEIIDVLNNIGKLIAYRIVICVTSQVTISVKS